MWKKIIILSLTIIACFIALYYTSIKYSDVLSKSNVEIPIQNLTKNLRIKEEPPVWFAISDTSISTYKNVTRPEIAYVQNALKGAVSTMVKYGRGAFNVNELSTIFSDLNRENIDKKGYSIVDEARIKTLDYVNLVTANFNSTGQVVDGFREFNMDVFKNIFDTFTIYDNDITTFETFKKFHDRLAKQKYLKSQQRLKNVS